MIGKQAIHRHHLVPRHWPLTIVAGACLAALLHAADSPTRFPADRVLAGAWSRLVDPQAGQPSIRRLPPDPDASPVAVPESRAEIGPQPFPAPREPEAWDEEFLVQRLPIPPTRQVTSPLPPPLAPRIARIQIAPARTPEKITPLPARSSGDNLAIQTDTGNDEGDEDDASALRPTNDETRKMPEPDGRLPAAPALRPADSPTFSSPALQPAVPDVPPLSPTRRVIGVDDPSMQQAAAMVRRSFDLAERGAIYSAHAELIRTLRWMAQSLDGGTGQCQHLQALNAGLRALDEADDFVPRGSNVDSDLNAAGYVASHRTPVLKDSPAGSFTPLEALQQYYDYAQQQLMLASGGQPIVSEALFALGKTQLLMTHESAGPTLDGPKAMTYFAAALSVDASNWRAANELGVLLARYGQWSEAKDTLLQGLRSHPSPEAWHNLAVVHEKLGERDLAILARGELRLAQGNTEPTPLDATNSSGQPTPPTGSTDSSLSTVPKKSVPQVTWVDPAAFAAMSPRTEMGEPSAGRQGAGVGATLGGASIDTSARPRDGSAGPMWGQTR